MVNLTKASKQLFSHSPDERYESLDALWRYCKEQKDTSLERWETPGRLLPAHDHDVLDLTLGDDGAFRLNDWSFGQLCRLCGVNKETINRLSPETASQALQETMPVGSKPLQLWTQEWTVRSIHGVAYTRLFNADLLEMDGSRDGRRLRATAQGRGWSHRSLCR